MLFCCCCCWGGGGAEGGIEYELSVKADMRLSGGTECELLGKGGGGEAYVGCELLW